MQDVKMMPFSHAIRLGGTTGRQIFGNLWDSKGGTCALGGALIAVGVSSRDYVIPREVIALFNRPDWNIHGNREHKQYQCPACSDMTRVIVTHLNDVHRWSREMIADHVEILELELEGAASLESLLPSSEDLDAVVDAESTAPAVDLVEA